VDKLRRNGYVKGPLGSRLPEFNKAKVREEMSMVDNADSIEICGAAPWAMHVCGSIGNECYLVDGQCHSGLSWEYFLLFRQTVDGRNQVYVHRNPVLLESSVQLRSATV
jgi:hypothetical protein